MNPYARPGDSIREKQHALQEEVRAHVVSGSRRGQRIHGTTDGKVVVAESHPEPFRGHWSIQRIGRDEVRVGDGSVNGVVPWIGRSRLNGESSSGREKRVPSLRLEGGPNEELRSWIAIRVTVDPETGTFDPEDPEMLRVEHVSSLEAEDPSQWLEAVAMIQWQDRKVLQRIRQILYFHQRHRFYPATEGRPARHAFSARA